MSSLESNPKARTDLRVRRESPDMLLIVDPELGRIHELDGPTSVHIWQNCTGDRSVSEIVESVLEEFDCPDRRQVEKEVREFLDILSHEKLIDLV